MIGSGLFPRPMSYSCLDTDDIAISAIVASAIPYSYFPVYPLQVFRLIRFVLTRFSGTYDAPGQRLGHSMPAWVDAIWKAWKTAVRLIINATR
jgi:hypothetical protein